MDISEVEDTNLEVQHGPETKQDRDNRMSNELKSEFHTLNRAGKKSELYSEHLQQQRVIIEDKCPHESCTERSKVASYKLSGGVLQVSWSCPNGHGEYWVSSSEYWVS